MPFANEHACRLEDPGQYIRFRRQNGIGEVDGKRLDAIIGFKSGGGSEVQSFRYPKSEGWMAGQARAHCNSHDGSFEAASEESAMTDINLVALEREIREADLEALDAYERGVAEAPVLYKAMGYKAADEGGGITTFVASEESEDRMGDVLESSGWELREFRRNPVFMLNHNYSILPIGTVPRISVQEKQLIAHVKWDEDDELAAFVKGKYQRGVMRGVSVGFRPLEWDRSDKGLRFKKQELLELSAVSVPAHPHALAKAMFGHLSIIRPEIITVEEPGALEPGLSELDQQIIMAALARFKEALR